MTTSELLRFELEIRRTHDAALRQRWWRKVEEDHATDVVNGHIVQSKTQ